MIKIKLYELDKHRNECAFRPYLAAQNTLREIGIEFTQGDSYDYAWIAQGSFLNKKVSLEESTETGLEFLSKINGDYMLLDGQDSTSLLGAYEVFKESKALLLMKNSLLKDRSLYKQKSALGRHYWGKGDYQIKDFDDYSDRIVLSGTNWLSTHWCGIQVQWYDINRPKQYDVSAMFQYPSPKKSYEHGIVQSDYYDSFRRPSIEALQNLEHDQFINITKLENGVRVSQEEYYNRTFNSKILFAPYGYGEMAPRDLEAAMFGSILIKPDMSYIDTIPNVYIDGETYIACKHDFSDLQEKITKILGNYKEYSYIIENSRKTFKEEMSSEKLAMYLYNMFKSINGITV
tara:strand:- start:89 stop:1126 length:1038 start_codon:yes stop_codon:yes gene_type:complete